MKTEELQVAADQIRHSSAYAAGDPTTFRVPFRRHEIELPAQSDPFAYFETLRGKLATKLPQEGRVAVIGAGYGGLCAAALLLGVKEVVAIEPRDRFRTALDRIVAILDKLYAPDQENTARVFGGWPQVGHIPSLGKFDLVVWPESFEECPDPSAVLEAALKMLAPGGVFVVEVTHGETEALPAAPVNSWRPSLAAFGKLVALVNDAPADMSTPGRGSNRTIYCLCAHEPKTAVIKRPALDEPFPRRPEMKTVYQVGYKAPVQAQPIPAPVPTAKQAPTSTAKPAPVAPPIAEADEPVVILQDDTPKKGAKKPKPDAK